MAQLIQPILDTFKALLQGMDDSTLGGLEPFREVKSAGVNFNFPFASVEPGRTVFDLDHDQSAAQGHSIVVQIGVTGSDPEELKNRVVAYAQAVWTAINKWPVTGWPTGMNVKEVAVMSIDYSSTWTSGTALARFVDITCVVGTEEYP